MPPLNGIHDSRAAIKIGLRVLVDYTSRRIPRAADVEILGWYAPDIANMDPDDLAREVVQRMLRRRNSQR